MFKWFKKDPIENASDYENMIVTLPKSQKEVVLSKILNDADEHEMEKEKPQIAGDNHLVKVNEETMTVGDLLKRYHDAMNSMKEKEEEPKKEDSKEEPKPEDKKEDSKDDESKPGDSKEEKKENTSDKKETKEEEENFEKISNAGPLKDESEKTITLSEDRVNLGKQRYGSGK